MARLAEARRRQEGESYDYAGVGIETLPGGGLVSGKIGRSDSFKPTNGMVEEAERGLEWRREFGRGGTSVGISRARDIKNGKNLPYATVGGQGVLRPSPVGQGSRRLAPGEKVTPRTVYRSRPLGRRRWLHLGKGHCRAC